VETLANVPIVDIIRALICLSFIIPFLLTFLLLSLHYPRSTARQCLGLYYLTFFYGAIYTGLFYSGLLSNFPGIYHTDIPCSLLSMPVSFLFVRALCGQKGISRWDSLHFLPAALYLMDHFTPFLPSAPSPHLLIAIQAIIYSLLQARILVRVYRTPPQKEVPPLAWMLQYTVLQLAIPLSMFTTPILPIAGALLSMTALYFHPTILYGLKTRQISKTKLSLDIDFVDRLALRLEKTMLEKKPFLNPDYTLRELANALDIPLYKLSAYLNQTLGTNFSEYLNQWRIRHCLELFHEKETEHLNLNGIAKKCGFNNRNTFSTAFKKITGKAPSAYLHADD
jgi:AraC-like DNA-binding protein